MERFMSSTFIARDCSAAELRRYQLQTTPAALPPTDLLREALGLSKAKATALLNHCGPHHNHPLTGLRQLTRTSLDAVGFSPREATRALAIIQLAQRLHAVVPAALPLESPEAAVAFLSADLMWETQEKFAVLLLDVKNRPIGQQVITIGTATETLAHPRDIFRSAIQAGATRLMVAHNHPSASVEPSPEDITLTEQLLQGAQTLGIPLLDHLILGGGHFTSLRQQTDLWESFPQRT